ncbi:MAG: hypothetical protein AB7S75_03230 [Desulfococcaceae bacterium]
MQAVAYSLFPEEKTDIPKALIYEMAEGKPVCYRGWRQYLLGEKSTEELRGSSYLQVFVIMKIMKHLLLHLPDSYYVFGNELGVIHEKGNWRCIDIAVYQRESLKDIPLENKYLTVPPEIAIEIDTKADTENFITYMDYVHKKTDDLLRFGVKKVIWIFTSSRKIMTASADEKWITADWSKPVSVTENMEIRLEEMLKEFEHGKT